MNDLIIMERQNIVDIADAIRNKTGVNDEMTLVDMVTSINEIELGGEELPSAEQDGVFGLATQNEEYGIVINDTSKINYYAYPGDFDIVVRYRAKEAFSLLGARAYLRSNNYSTKFTVSVNGELKATFNIPYREGVKVWTNRYFDQQYNIAVGDVIEIRQTYVSYPTFIPLSATTINGKVEITYSAGGSGGENPSAVHGVYDIIMAPVQAELPDKYQIERATMDDMAVEVQRISGISTKLTLSQIQSNLESVKLQEKSVSPALTQQTIKPDTGYIGLSSVSVNPVLLQEKIATPTAEEQIVSADNGYHGLSAVKIEPISAAEKLTNAEDAVFGISSGVQENAILNATNKGSTSSKYLYGWSFEAKDPITIIGLRCYENFSTSYPHELKVWNEQKECLVTVTCYSQANNAWTNVVYLDTPINVDTGKTYTVTICRSILDNGIGSAYADLSTVTFNPKITYIHSVSGRTVGDKNTFPADTYTSSVPMVDMIITEQEVIPPDNYQIQRVTVDNIAVEMQRITGQSMKLSTAQIQSGLESIVLQEKIVTPTTEQQEIVPDEGYYGFSKVTVEAVESLPENVRLYYIGTGSTSFTFPEVEFECSADIVIEEV